MGGSISTTTSPAPSTAISGCWRSHPRAPQHPPDPRGAPAAAPLAASFLGRGVVQEPVHPRRAIVDELDGALDLRRMFSRPEADWWARLPRPTSIETLVQYWRGQVDPFYDPAIGTVVVRVRAFAARDALQLAQAIVTASEKLVNELSSRAR